MSANETNISEQMVLRPARLTLAITGHRDTNAAFLANKDKIRTVLSDLFAFIQAETRDAGTTELYSLLAQGADLMAVELALERGWNISAPLPFGRALNITVNSHPETVSDAKILLAGKKADDPSVQARANQIRQFADRATIFELSEQDETITRVYLDALSAPEDSAAQDAFAAFGSKRATSAARVMIEHSMIMVAIWDGSTLGSAGATRHSMAAALEHGAPVIWINAVAPEDWCLLTSSESLVAAKGQDLASREADLKVLISTALLEPASEPGGLGLDALGKEKWHGQSNRFYHSYRRIEALFGGTASGSRFGNLVQHYETPDEIASGSAAPMLAAVESLPSGDPAVTKIITQQLLRRFAWADGLSTHLSDAYRGSMVNNFVLSTMAIVGGILYLPLGKFAVKWPFALFEFVILILILSATIIGRRRRWHNRWFETRRVAEYLRHAPILMLLGVARAPGLWPKGTNTNWPEHYARNMLQAAGLPSIAVTTSYLRGVLEKILLVHVVGQRDYHRAKAERLAKIHHNLDHMSEICFILAVVSVGIFLALAGAANLGLIVDDVVNGSAKLFTFLGVLFPSLGGLFAGIRFFGDFERFAAISKVTAEKLDAIEHRISILVDIPENKLQFDQVAELAHTVDDIVIDEIENWQAVFGGKQMSVPV